MESELCGFEGSEAQVEEHERTHEVVLTRDGWWGQYLSSVLVQDVDSLLVDAGKERIPEDVREDAAAWLGAMGPSGSEVSAEQSENVLDWATYWAGERLSEIGLRLFEGEDGYIVFRCPLDDPELERTIARHPASS